MARGAETWERPFCEHAVPVREQDMQPEVVTPWYRWLTDPVNGVSGLFWIDVCLTEPNVFAVRFSEPDTAFAFRMRWT